MCSIFSKSKKYFSTFGTSYFLIFANQYIYNYCPYFNTYNNSKYFFNISISSFVINLIKSV